MHELRGLQTHSGEFLIALEARERERSGIANLKVEYNKVHGFYIEVSRAQSDKVPDDYRRWALNNLTDMDTYLRKALEA
ncbi:MAG: hypothetical protein B7Z70_15420 [Acidithiobacillus ferrivorans]|uniref:DNA mismatch repair protein MutS clamp domain-containing protein n=1 Tax=Acidithiobacillus ferrivorans TaxID=160808 RepID=A0A257SFZ0_9PROT|nr:MAG: hypothetical protein B7Z70_15420 [Acidithiobacillus ferrivorans]